MIVGNSMQPNFVVVPHTADLKIHVTGRTSEELFKHALVGMFQSIKPDAPDCGFESGLLVCETLPQQHMVEVHSPDKESLLIDFLSEALYLSDLHSEAYLDLLVHAMSDTRLRATLCGVKVVGFQTEIKAVTYHDVHITRVNDFFAVDIVFDI